MTEHEPVQSGGWYDGEQLTDNRFLVYMPSCEYVLRRDELCKLRDTCDRLLEGEGPQIVCEVVR